MTPTGLRNRRATGNDTLYGGAGADSYIFNLGDGQDIISEFGQGSGGHDRIVFGEGIAPEDIIVTQANNGLDIVLSIAGTTDRVTISYGNAWYPEYRVDEVVFANGTSWTFTDLLARATAPTAGNDVIYGSIDGESLSGGGGDDWISANAAPVTIRSSVARVTISTALIWVMVRTSSTNMMAVLATTGSSLVRASHPVTLSCLRPMMGTISCSRSLARPTR